MKSTRKTKRRSKKASKNASKKKSINSSDFSNIAGDIKFFDSDINNEKIKEVKKKYVSNWIKSIVP